jgi:medium-chain acyl-[acyl-carrier-protein] hydrolase
MSPFTHFARPLFFLEDVFLFDRRECTYNRHRRHFWSLTLPVPCCLLCYVGTTHDAVPVHPLKSEWFGEREIHARNRSVTQLSQNKQPVGRCFDRPPATCVVGQIICFSHAGGSSATFREWEAQLAGRSLELMSAEMPGKGRRFKETPLCNVHSMAEEAAVSLERVLRLPFVLFGHSLGGLVAFETARILESRGLIPLYLIVAAARAPHLPRIDKRTYDLPDAEFVEELKDLQGTPAELLADLNTMKVFLPAIRADFKAVDSYSYAEGRNLQSPIAAFLALDDTRDPGDDSEAWGIHTQTSFTLRRFPGGHFFVQDDPAKVIEAVLHLIPPSLWNRSLSPQTDRSFIYRSS